MIRYEDLTLALTADGTRIEVWESPFGRGASGPFLAPKLDSELETLLDATSLAYRDARRHERPADFGGDLAALGRRLYSSLFPDEVAGVLLRSFTQAAASEGRLGIRIRLILRWPPHLRYLQSLPWETLSLVEESGSRFLARQVAISIVRTPMAKGHPATREPVEPPLRVLLLLSQPKDSTPLALEAEKQRIEAGFAKAAGFFGIAPPVLKVVAAPLTVDAFRAALREGFHVVHFAGHGDFEEASGAGALLFENEDRSVHAFRGATLAEHLQLCPGLRLVVLNACWSALPGADGEGEADLGVGTSLAENGVPAVVAMQRPIGDVAAVEFAGNLYAQLSLGDPLELAMCHARVKLAEKFPASPSWAIPVLLMGAADGNIVVPAGQAANASSSLARHVRNVTWLIAEKTRDFVGREFLFDKVGRKIAEGERCLLVTAEPGFGKTSFMAELVKRRRHVHHFNRLASADSNQTEHFLANVTAQLILKYKLPYPVLPVQAQRSSSFLLEICAEAARKLEGDEKLVLMVDALDEVDNGGQAITRNPLDLPEVLPEKCVLLVTCRPATANRPEMNFEGGPYKIELLAGMAENQADIAEFVRRSLDQGQIPAFLHATKLSGDQLVAQLVERSEGNFMYLRYVLDDLQKGRFEAGTIDHLPQGLRNYYQQQWQRLELQAGNRFFDLALPALAALTAIRQPLSASSIAQMIGRPQDRSQIVAMLGSLRQFLRVEDHPQNPRAKVYQVYHGSFHDFVRCRPEIAELEMDEQVRLFIQESRKGPGAADVR